ncbi:MAG TPA: NAD(P)H-hydrate dehydratase [Methanomassiliicoccales archaeon]|nr:NAD(P)H-hydrate dehydratase [Methanomassiliicoccales archaeon]
MMKWEEVKVLDANSEHLGISTEMLMENAGWAVAHEISSRFGEGLRIAIVCGHGNNGGDGAVAARALTKMNVVKVLLASSSEDARTPEARTNFEKVEELHKVFADDRLADYDLIVDALMGVGLKGVLREPYAGMVRAMNACGRPIVSVDIPSGLGTQIAVRPTLTVTFHALKEGMTSENCGEIVIKDIGIPADAERYLGPGEMVYYPIPSPEVHKGQNGRVLVIGGGPYTGAPALAALGAYRVGADLVFVACPAAIRDVVASYSPNIITIPIPGDVLTEEHVAQLIDFVKGIDAVLIGPGLGDDPRTLKAVRELIRDCSKPMVLDADALKALAGNLDTLKGGTGVLTPHHRELEILRGADIPSKMMAREEAAVEIARDSGWTVLVKGKIDLVTDGDRVKYNRTGNVGMSVGGTGDVLAGITVGLMAKKVSPYNAARMSAFLNGSAGDLAFEKYSYGLMATDLLDRVPQVLRRGLSRTH